MLLYSSLDITTNVHQQKLTVNIARVRYLFTLKLNNPKPQQSNGSTIALKKCCKQPTSGVGFILTIHGGYFLFELNFIKRCSHYPFIPKYLRTLHSNNSFCSSTNYNAPIFSYFMLLSTDKAHTFLDFLLLYIDKTHTFLDFLLLYIDKARTFLDFLLLYIDKTHTFLDFLLLYIDKADTFLDFLLLFMKNDLTAFAFNTFIASFEQNKTSLLPADARIVSNTKQSF